MQITCSKCKKAYSVDPKKIPGGVTGTKCKACGNSIALRPVEPQNTAPPKAAVLQITCQYCSKKYNINPKSIPAGVTSMTCKSCRHVLSLKSRSATPAQEPVAAKTAKPNTDTRQIICLYCGKKYSIKASKIPAGVTTSRCKACGRNLSLQPAAGLTSPFKDEISKKVGSLKSVKTPQNQQAPQVRIFPNIEPSAPPLWRKPWALAAAAAVVIACTVVYYTGSKLTQLAKIKLSAETVVKKDRQVPAQRGQSEATAGLQPLLAAKVDVPLLLEAIDQNTPEDKKNFNYKLTAGILKSFGLSKIQLYLYPHPEYTYLPVILAESVNGKNLEKQLKSHGNYMQFLERLPDGSYAFKKQALPEGKQINFPIDLYRLQFAGNFAVFAPQHISGILKEGKDPLRQSQVAKMLASISRPRDLILLSFRIPENFSQDLQKKIQSNTTLQQNPQTAMIAAIGSGMLAQLSEPLKGVESLAIGFRLDDKNSRQLSYAQQFRKGVNGRKIYQQLKSGNRNDLNINGVVLKLVDLLKDPRYHHHILYDNNRLTLELSWEKQHDKTILASLSQATLGQMFAQSMDLTPSEGPITVQYKEPPRIVANVNMNNLKQMIPGVVRQNLFPGNFWNLEDRPRMTLDLNPIDIPNASLAHLTYEVLEVLTSDGTNVIRTEENQFQHKIRTESASPGHIDLNLKKGTAVETLGTAKIRFQISLPARFKKFEFAPANSTATRRESEGVWVQLDRLEKDVAKISYGGGASAQLFAFDRTGRALASAESLNSTSAVATRFQGEISSLMVVVVQEMLDYPFEVNVDLSGGKKLSLSHQPGNYKR